MPRRALEGGRVRSRDSRGEGKKKERQRLWMIDRLVTWLIRLGSQQSIAGAATQEAGCKPGLPRSDVSGGCTSNVSTALSPIYL